MVDICILWICIIYTDNSNLKYNFDFYSKIIPIIVRKLDFHIKCLSPCSGHHHRSPLQLRVLSGESSICVFHAKRKPALFINII